MKNTSIGATFLSDGSQDEVYNSGVMSCGESMHSRQRGFLSDSFLSSLVLTSTPTTLSFSPSHLVLRCGCELELVIEVEADVHLLGISKGMIKKGSSAQPKVSPS